MRYAIEFQRRDGSNSWRPSHNYHSTTHVRLDRLEFTDLASAQREAAVQESNSLRNVYRARDTQPELAAQGGDMPAIATPARAVRIYRRNREWVIDTGGRPSPTVRDMRLYLPPSLRDQAYECGYVLDALKKGINPQILATALSAWYVEHPNTDDMRIEEGISELPDNNAYVALGDYIYKMVTVRRINSSKAIRLMREKVRADFERVREGLRQQASNEAQQLIVQANMRAAQIRADAQRELDDVTSASKFPAWTKGLTVRMDSDRDIYILRKVTIPTKEFTHGNLVWKAKEAPPVSVWLWLPLKGNPESVSLFDTSQGYLPHISSGSACMKIGEEVKPIVNHAALEKFIVQVSRVHSIINLASLLNSDMHTWLPEVQDATPDSIKRWLDVYTSISEQAHCDVEHLPSGHTTVRGEETWSVR